MGNIAPRQDAAVGYQDSLNDHPEVAHLNPDQFRDLIGRGLNRDLALVPFQMPRQVDTNWASLLEKKPRPTVILQNLVGIHKQSLALVRMGTTHSYCVAFSFDALAPVTILVQFGRGSPLQYNFPAGLDQCFSQPTNHACDVTEFASESSDENAQKNRAPAYPLIITLEAKREKEEEKQPEHGSKIYVITSYCTITRKSGDQLCSAVVLEQRISLCKRSYELLEVYGVGEESLAGGDTLPGDDNVCIVCTVNPRTVTIFPCRHTYLCSECIEMLRSQTNRCPICRCAVESAVDLSICDTFVSSAPLPQAENGSEIATGPAAIEIHD